MVLASSRSVNLWDFRFMGILQYSRVSMTQEALFWNKCTTGVCVGRTTFEQILAKLTFPGEIKSGLSSFIVEMEHLTSTASKMLGDIATRRRVSCDALISKIQGLLSFLKFP
jgi:predicted DNA-binding ribbon-helix-helix protein